MRKLLHLDRLYSGEDNGSRSIGVAMNFPRIALCSLLLLIATAPLMAQGTYTEIHVPGAITTECRGINARGDVVGTYEDTSAFYHGFLLSGGTYTTIDYSGGLETFLFGLNNFGQIIGTTRSEVAFVYDTSTQAFTVLAYPGSKFTWPQAINDAGVVVGYIEYGQTATSGFEWKDSTYIPISPPG